MDENIGKKIGKRRVIAFVGYTKRGAIYLFECECTQRKELLLAEVKNGRYQSCAQCYLRESKRKRHEKYRAKNDLT